MHTDHCQFKIDRLPQSWTLSPQRTIRIDRPLCFGILNITPDSFFDGAELSSIALAGERARAMVDEGADGLDIGGESTRPGAARVGDDEQIRRVVPVIEAIRKSGIELPITVDTTRSTVARAALDAGGDAINDVSAGCDDKAMIPLVAERGCGMILMHRVMEPQQDRYSDQYEKRPIEGDVVAYVVSALGSRRDEALSVGVDRRCIVLDPGLGFGKDVGQNLALIRQTRRLVELGHLVLSGLSRKSFVGRVSLGRDSEPTERLEGTLALSVLHLGYGARLFRVHDVGAHRRALDAAWRCLGADLPEKISILGQD